MALANALISSLSVSLVSFTGILILIKKITKESFVITAMISFAAGSLLGDVFIHLLGEHIEEFGYTDKTILGVMIGILLMLVLEAYLHCSHDSEHELEVEGEHKHTKSHIAKLNLASDGLHNLLDGIAIGASFLVSTEAGIATTIAVILHEIPQELADVSILVYAGWSRSKILFMNFITALASIVGVFTVFAAQSISEKSDQILVPIAAGQFIYIALADLVPEIHKKKGVKKYILEISTFILGIVLMYALLALE